MQLIIVADDLTGAADCAARCHSAGLDATIVVNSEAAATRGWQNRSVVALNFDSRHLPPAAAAERVRQRLTTLLAEPQSAVWYKKIDSTLRGNLGAELAAMLPLITPAGQQPCAIISPAFPAQQRGLRHGALVYEHSNAPRHLPTLLAEQTTLPLTLIELNEVRQGKEHLAQQLRSHYLAGIQLLVVDGISDNDLETLVDAARHVLPNALLCGSAGLILPLAAQLRLGLLNQKPTNDSHRGPRSPTLVIVGSGSEMAHRQIATVEHRGAARVLTLDPTKAVIDPERATDGLAPLLPLAKDENLLLHLPKPDRSIVVEGHTARQMATLLVAVASRLIEQMQPQTLILVGGDTAQLTMAQLGIQQLDVVNECQPGMPLSIGIDAHGRSRHLILKAGNHGDEESLLKLIIA